MRIKELRMARNMTQDELAKRLDVSRTTVTMWENGSTFPRTELLPKLANVFACKIDELFLPSQ